MREGTVAPAGLGPGDRQEISELPHRDESQD